MSEAQFRELVQRDAEGDALAPDERAFLREYAEQHAEARAELELIKALRGTLESSAPAALELGDERLIAESWRRGERERRARRTRSIAAPALLIASAAAYAWWVSNRAPATAPVAGTSAAAVANIRVQYASAGANVDGRAALAGALLPKGTELDTASGSLCLWIDTGVRACAAPGSRLLIGNLGADTALELKHGWVVAELERQPAGRTFSIATRRGAVTAKGTRFAVQVSEAGVLLRVSEGAVRVSSSQPKAATQQEAVELVAPASAWLGSTARADFDALAAQRDRELLAPARLFSGSRFAILQIDAATQPYRVDGTELSGPASLLLDPGARELSSGAPPELRSERLELAPGAHVRRSLLNASPDASGAAESAPSSAPAHPGSASAGPAAVTDPAEVLLLRARQLRTEGKMAEAARTYRRLLAQYPGHAAALAASVSLGQLELTSFGNASGALSAFDLYLKRGGPLEQEARYGKIRALAALGKSAEELREIDVFLSRYPSSVQAEALRIRRQALFDAASQ
jgi:ferric-dicitrate binding protein FerR (iron transport regulator)